MREMSSIVVSGRSRSARSVKRKMYSSRGPQESPNIRFKTPITSEEMFDFRLGSVTSSGLNPSGNSVSLGLK